MGKYNKDNTHNLYSSASKHLERDNCVHQVLIKSVIYLYSDILYPVAMYEIPSSIIPFCHQLYNLWKESKYFFSHSKLISKCKISYMHFVKDC